MVEVVAGHFVPSHVSAPFREEVIEPDLAIVDAHHHLFDAPPWEYELQQYLTDAQEARGILSSILVECHVNYRPQGPPELRSLGETEYFETVARQASDVPRAPRVGAAMIGRADLTLGESIGEVLDQHIEVSQGGLSGIRQVVARDADPATPTPMDAVPEQTMSTRAFRMGLQTLASRDLSFDVWCYHPQLPEVVDLARSLPDVRFVLDHLGGPLGVGRYANQPERVFDEWRRSMRELGQCPNVCIKFGGLGMRTSGARWHEGPERPGSTVLAAAWRPWFDVTMEAFGPVRTMFESNFPMEKPSYSYGAFWNACKRLASDLSVDERQALLSGTATRTYRINGESPAGAV